MSCDGARAGRRLRAIQVGRVNETAAGARYSQIAWLIGDCSNAARAGVVDIEQEASRPAFEKGVWHVPGAMQTNGTFVKIEIARNFLEPFGPVVPVAGEAVGALIGAVKLDPVTGNLISWITLNRLVPFEGRAPIR